MRSIAKNLSLTYRAEAEAVPAVRRALSEFARGAGAAPSQVEAVRLATSEAVTNSVLHAYRDEPGNVYVTAAVVSDELWVLVADDGGGLEPQSNRPGLGLGLGLISQVSDELAIVPRACGGIEVRMRFDLVGVERMGTRGQCETDGVSGPQLRRAVPAERFRGRQQYA